jgi:hypothetical protein
MKEKYRKTLIRYKFGLERFDVKMQLSEEVLGGS